MKMNAGTGAGAGAGANARKRKRTHARARSFIHSFMCPRGGEENPKRLNCHAKRKRAHERTSARTMKMNADTTQTQTSARTCTLIHSFKRKRAHERTNDENERGHMRKRRRGRKRKRKRTHARARSFTHSFMCPRDGEGDPKRLNCHAKRKRAHERTSARTMKMNAGTTQTQTSARTCTLIHSFIHVPAR